MDAHLSYLLFLGPWVLLAGILALAGRLLAGPRPRGDRGDASTAGADGPVCGWPMTPLAGAVAIVALLLILRAHHGPGDTISAAVLLLVLVILLLHVARRGVLPDSDAPGGVDTPVAADAGKAAAAHQRGPVPGDAA